MHISKPILIRIKNSSTTLDVANNEIPTFYNPLHFHPELELTYIEKSSGTRIIGDSIESFSAGDLVLVGPNTPHFWKNDMCKDSFGEPIPAKAIVIKFMPDFVGSFFWEIPEMRPIKHVIYETSKQGMKLEGGLCKQVTTIMKQLINASPANQIIFLLEILSLITESSEYRLLSGVTHNTKEDIRICKIISFLQNNYNSSINLDTIAKMIFMHKNSVCNFFHKNTGKTIFEMLHEIRIKRACYLLANTNDSIENIGSKVGYFSQSLFNRKFKQICKTTPLAYRKIWFQMNKLNS